MSSVWTLRAFDASAADMAPEDSRRLNALARRENEVGAGAAGPALVNPPIHCAAVNKAESTQADHIALRIQVAALENLVIALLAAGNEGQKSIAQTMAHHATPRGVLPHPLMVHIVAHLGELVSRAETLRRLHATSSG